MATIIKVSTEADLDAAIAQANAAPSGSSFEIDLQASISETYVVLNSVSLPSGVTLSINDGVNTLTGPYALAPAVTINSGSTLTAVGTVPTSEVIAFVGPGVANTVLDIATLSSFSGTIEDFASGDTLGIASTITAAATGAGTYNSTTNTTSLTLKDGITTVGTLRLEGDYSGASFNVADNNVTVVLPSVATTLSGGSLVSGTQEVANGATTAQTGQITLGSSGDAATVINQGTYAITGAWGISAGNTSSLLINDGTLERAANGVNGVSYIDVNMIDTGTIIVPDNNPSGSATNLRFDGANNSFSGIYIGGGMIDYGNPNDLGVGTTYLGNIDMQSGACTTSWDTVDQNGVVTLSSSSTIGLFDTWNFTSDNGIAEENPNQGSSANFTTFGGTLAKTGGTGTTVIGVTYDRYGGSAGDIVVDTGTLAFDGPTINNFDYQVISGPGTFSLGGGAADAIGTSTTITTGGWLINGSGTDVTVDAALSYAGAFTQQSGTTLTLNHNLTFSSSSNPATFSGTIVFVKGSDATLGVGDLSGTLGTISGFASGDTINLLNQDFTTADHINYDSSTGLLTITNPTDAVLATLAFAGAYDQSEFHASGTAITTSACYCRGTLIRTERGDLPVEVLTVGRTVLTKSGEERPIKWIGRRSYGGRFIMGRKDMLPICVKAGALDDSVPQRDLWLSPHHALYLDGMLIEAKDLINGVSIVQVDAVEQVEYFHIELETHDVIVAEGALAESFIDDDSRDMFSNAQEYRELYGDVTIGLAQFCAPRLEEGYEVEAVRERIALRAGMSSKKNEPFLGGLRGFVDRVNGESIEGWAQNTEHSEAPVCLDIYGCGRLIGQVLANRYREDLAKARLGSGRHAFMFTPPSGLIIGSDKVEIRRSLDGAVLPRAWNSQTAA
jgi:hypothetical protein